ncbi:hypothetical protein [Nocardia sp. NBC_01329]|uniref:hypothetical protein n=1 Tax=Nocardia sp. NBC_01329 TaxID=2903594 RepID=UPI002E0D31FA|nr:hypothetical protein OG405_13150 [Nocardia sp. NBC_01329]
MTRIDTAAALEQWLEQRGWFEDSPAPLIDTSELRSLGCITLRLEEHFRSGWTPGSAEVVEPYLVIARNVMRYNSIPAWSPDHIVEEVDGGGTNEGLFLEIDFPGLVRIECTEIDVERLPAEYHMVPPWTSGVNFTLTTTEGELPPAEFWRDQAEERIGNSVVWRTLGGPAGSPRDYAGWFLELSELVADTEHGVFCFHASAEAEGWRVNFQRTAADDALWQAVQATAAIFTGTVNSGNCTFTTPEWERYLCTGEFPQP